MSFTSPRHRPPLFLLLLAAAGCATQASGSDFAEGDAAAAQAAPLVLAPPAQGFQVETRPLAIEPGEDIRWCEVVKLPGGPSDVYYVGRIETAMTEHSQDLIVSAAAVGSETDAAMEPGAQTPCTRAGEAFGEDVVALTSSQLAYHDQRYPTGVGQVLRGGQKLAIDYHSVNPSEQPVSAQVKLNFHTVAREAVVHSAHLAGFDNLTIYTPPGGRSSHLAECRVNEELVISELVRRTQSRGTRFRVWIAGGERDGDLLWVSRGPGDTRVELHNPLHLSPGEGLRFQCDYVNNTDLELRYGVNASDEMCNLGATYWLPDERPEAAPQGCLLLQVDPDGVARK
jgi:hypothetical protein